MEDERKPTSPRIITMLMETFGLSYAAAFAAALFIGAVLLLAVFWFYRAAPPKSLVITAGTPGSSFETNAYKYRDILARSGITLQVMPSHGSRENLERL